jgi:hypothetical protein
MQMKASLMSDSLSPTANNKRITLGHTAPEIKKDSRKPIINIARPAYSGLLIIQFKNCSEFI